MMRKPNIKKDVVFLIDNGKVNTILIIIDLSIILKYNIIIHIIKIKRILLKS